MCFSSLWGRIFSLPIRWIIWFTHDSLLIYKHLNSFFISGYQSKLSDGIMRYLLPVSLCSQWCFRVYKVITAPTSHERLESNHTPNVQCSGRGQQPSWRGRAGTAISSLIWPIHLKASRLLLQLFYPFGIPSTPLVYSFLLICFRPSCRLAVTRKPKSLPLSEFLPLRLLAVMADVHNPRYSTTRCL